ncbi:hypothetical protein BGY98DRAFT_954533 [Russula aff. rugulosa BPL654]|nr:hypothetical protein BGY98DRAFT_954533 [Russula aff. rugulosa BPL654]
MDLRVHIKNEKSHKLGTYWIASCVGIHAFAMHCEAEKSLTIMSCKTPSLTKACHRHHHLTMLLQLMKAVHQLVYKQQKHTVKG